MVQSSRRGVSELDNIKVLPYPRELPQTNVYKSNSCLSPISGLFLTPLYTHTLFYFAFLNSPAPFSSPQPPPHFLFLPLNSLQIQPPSPPPRLWLLSSFLAALAQTDTHQNPHSWVRADLRGLAHWLGCSLSLALEVFYEDQSGYGRSLKKELPHPTMPSRFHTGKGSASNPEFVDLALQLLIITSSLLSLFFCPFLASYSAWCHCWLKRVLVAHSCLTLCDHMDCSPPGSSIQGDCPDKNAGVSGHSLLQGIFPTQGLNPRLPHCRQILHCLGH